MKRIHGKMLVIAVLLSAVLAGLAAAAFPVRKCLQRQEHPGRQLVQERGTVNERGEGRPWKA